MAITQRALNSLHPNTELRDDRLRGFGIRRQTNAAVWFLDCRVDGKRHRIRLGSYPALDLDAARVAALSAKAKAEQGINVAEEERRAKRRRVAERASSVDAAIAEFKRRHLDGLRRGAGVERALRAHLPTNEPLASVTKDDIRTMRAKIVEGGHPVMANRVFGRRGRSSTGASSKGCWKPRHATG